MGKKTKILATIGPASDSVETLRGMIKAGVDVFRLNFSHGTHSYHLNILNNIQTAQKDIKRKSWSTTRYRGSKIRVGELKEKFI